jgi:replicative DNA helicase
MSFANDYLNGFYSDAESFDKTKSDREDIICKDIADWSEEWFKSILPENNKLSLKFPKWDAEFKGKLRSKLVPIIGYGGTKKSLLAQNIVYDNITRGLGTCLYSTMEMGASTVIDRLIDMHVEPNSLEYNPHQELEYHHNITRKINAKDFYDSSFSPAFKGNFFITQNTSLITESYDKLISNFNEKNKKIDILVVDGISGMGGNGSETELYSSHSKELKDLANRWNILVLLICHVSKGGKKTDRDLSKLVRSSEKIIDNCDFYISASLFEEGEEKYNPNYGALRLVNKRGTGNTIDVVYDFYKQRLLMEQSDLDLSDFEHNKIAGL